MTTIPDILDNSEGRKVGTVLARLLVEAQEPASIDIATAYFNLGGFSILEEGLRQAKRVRLLSGKVQEQDFVLGDARLPVHSMGTRVRHRRENLGG